MRQSLTISTVVYSWQNANELLSRISWFVVHIYCFIF